jgi:hypothetical protein
MAIRAGAQLWAYKRRGNLAAKKFNDPKIVLTRRTALMPPVSFP